MLKDWRSCHTHRHASRIDCHCKGIPFVYACVRVCVCVYVTYVFVTDSEYIIEDPHRYVGAFVMCNVISVSTVV